MNNGRCVSFLLLFSAALVFSQPPRDCQQPGKMPIMPPFGSPRYMQGMDANPQPMMMNIAELRTLMAEINIDKAVAAKIVGIARAFQSTLEEHLIGIQREELTIKDALLKEKPDLQAIQTAISKKTQIFGEIEFSQIKRDLDIKSLLTEDEYDQWKSAMIRKMRDMMPGIQDKHPPNSAEKKSLQVKQR